MCDSSRRRSSRVFVDVQARDTSDVVAISCSRAVDESNGRPFHVAHSPWDPGFIVTENQHPKSLSCLNQKRFVTVSIFSAPRFMFSNQNSAAVVRLVKSPECPVAMLIESSDSAPSRPVQLPGVHRNAFSWSAAALWGAACEVAVVLLSEDNASVSPSSPAEEKEMRAFRGRMELLARLLRTNSPAIALQDVNAA